MINLNDEIKNKIYKETKCNSIYNSLVITHEKISNCCCKPPLKIIKNKIKLKDNFLSCLKCSSKIKFNKIKSKKIIFLNVIPFYKCNAECLICDTYNKNETFENYLDLEILKKYDFSDLKDLTISGGEVFLEEKYIINLLNLFNKNINLTIITNGTIFNKNILDKINEFKNKILIISIDGFKKNNEKFRKNCSYNLIKKNIEKIKKEYNFDLKIIFTISKFNFENLYDIEKIENDLELIVQTPFLIEPEIFSVYNNINKSKIKEYLKSEKININLKKELFKILRGEYE